MSAALAQSVPVRPARNEAELASLEAAYAVLDLYVWLSHRLEDGFPGRTAAMQQRAAVAGLVEEALPRILADPEAISKRCASDTFASYFHHCKFLLCSLAVDILASGRSNS